MESQKLTEVASWKSFGGFQKIFSHQSETLKVSARFSLYLPPGAENGNQKFPVVYWLSGLTCTEENFIQKSGIQNLAAKHSLIVVGPDTSPRGCNIEGDKDSWDFGEGAGFYVDAIEDKWKTNYNMYSYVTRELPQLLAANFNFADTTKQAIMGHSMGGHGALICALKNPGQYRSASAFAPISNPVNCPWGKKVFGGYLGTEQKIWKQYDATELSRTYEGPVLAILADQGTEDKFYKEAQLLPENFKASANSNKKLQIDLRFQEGYDHSYFFVASFLEQHVEFHVKHLNA